MDFHKQCKCNADQKSDTQSDSMSVKSVNQITESISKEIVAGVKQATLNNNDDVSDMGDSQKTKRKAESGSVGTFIQNRRQKTSNAGTWKILSQVTDILCLLIIEFTIYFNLLFTRCQILNNNSYLTLSAVSVNTSHNCNISNIQHTTNDACLGIDSHVDMSCAGKNARIIGIEEVKTLTVYPVDNSMSPSKEIKTVYVAYAYETTKGRTIILQVNHCLDFTSTLQHPILCTNQAWANNIIVDDCPKLLNMTNTSTQSIIFPENDTELPILFNGPVPFINVRYPTDEDI